MREEYEWAKSESDDAMMNFVDGSPRSLLSSIFYGCFEKASEPVTETWKEAKRNFVKTYDSGLEDTLMSKAGQSIKGTGAASKSLLVTLGMQTILLPLTALLRGEQAYEACRDIKDKYLHRD